MTQRQRTFRVFISSTFSDLKAERDALQAHVFPRLRELCAAHGFRFHAIDLRWGVRDEASLDQRTMNICLDEIRRCQRMTPRPNFVVLLGDRHGWLPLPAEIDEAEFLAVRGQIPAGADRDLLDDWYRRDANAVPPIFCLRPRAGEYRDRRRWSDVEARLQPLLRAAAEQANVQPIDLRKYVQSATEQEIMLGAMGVSDAREHVFAFLRRVRGMPVGADAAGIAAGARFRDLRDGRPDRRAAGALRRLRTALRQRLGPHVRRYFARWTGTDITTDHVRRLCDDVYAALSQAILAQIERFSQTEALDDEIAEHRAFALERCAHFQGRTWEVSQTSAYLQDSTRSPMVVVGASGAGKSALMAKIAETAEELIAGAVVIRRFIGVTPDSAQPASLLAGLCREASRSYGLVDHSLPTNRHQLADHLRRCMAAATAHRPLVLVIDSLDQFADLDRRTGWPAMVDWIPRELPDHVRMVVSVLQPDDTAVESAYASLIRRLPLAPTVELRSMSAVDGQALLESWLRAAGRTLQPQQQQAVLTSFTAHGLPLHLRLAFEECRRWRSDAIPPPVPDTIPAIITMMFARLSADHGRNFVERALGYLAASRGGLSEDELLDVFAIDTPFMDDFVAQAHHDLPADPRGRRLPVVVWSRLFADLEPFLAHHISPGVPLLTFYHRQLGDAAGAQFLAGPKLTDRAQLLARYFGSQPDWHSTGIPNRRKAWEQAFQLTQAGTADRLRSLLTDTSRLEAKCAAGLFFDSLADCDRALATGDSPAIAAARSALELAQPAIVSRPHLAGQAFWNVLSWLNVADSAVSDAVDRGRSLLRARPYAILAESPPTGARSLSRDVTIDHPLAAAAYAVSPSGQSIAVLAHGADGVFRIHDASSGEQIDERRVGEPATAIAFVDDHTLAALTPAGRIIIDGVPIHADAASRQNVLAFHRAVGLIGVHGDGAMVAWSLNPGASAVQIAGGIGAVACVRCSGDGRTIVALRGESGPLVYRRTNHEAWQPLRLPPLGPPAVDCDLSADGHVLAVLSRDRRLRIVALDESGPPVVLGQFAYEAAPAGVRGPPEWCAITGESTVVFSTFDGMLASFNWIDNVVRRLPDYRTKQGQGLLLCVRPVGHDRILLGADRWARFVPAIPGDACATPRSHAAAVTSAAITADGVVASVSEVGQSVAWHQLRGLPLLTTQSHRKPTAIAIITGDDAVLLGNASGHLWRQPRQGLPAEVTHAFADAVTTIAVVGRQYAVAGRSGRVVLADGHADIQQIVALPRPYREQMSLLPAGQVGLLWSITRDENVPGTPPGSTSTVVSLWSHDRTEAIAWVDPRRYEAAAASVDGRRIFLASRWESLLLTWNGSGLAVESRRSSPVTLAAFVVADGTGEELLMTALADESWLELWRLTPDLAVASAVRLPVRATAIAAIGSQVVAGLASGELASFRVYAS